MPTKIPTNEEFERMHNEQYETLCTARGAAMNSYAGVEEHLAALLAAFGEMPEDVAHIIFYKIVNSRARLEILDKLKKRKIGVEYNLFWNSILREVRIIDQGRNELAHWHAITKMDVAYPAYVALKPPTYGYGSEAELTVEKCAGFMAHCAAITDTLNMFWAAMVKRPPPDDALLDIFQREVVYPLQEGDPLSQRLERLYGLPRSSRE